jgi:hypothetical protein
VKKVHKALHLRHHKHTGKLLAHKHTSYRVLFLLMLLPVIALALVDRLDVAASDLVVSASVPAAIPADPAVITSPNDGETILTREVAVNGTCPVISPAIIVAIYNNGALAGSASCTASGTFSVPITLSYGTNALVPKVVTITGDIGASGPTVTVTFPTAFNNYSYGGSGLSGVSGIGTPLRVVSQDIYALITADGNTAWHGNIAGGSAPYHVKIDWGDGNTDTITVTDSAEQTFSHHYGVIQSYNIKITVDDTEHETVTLHIAGVTRFVQTGTAGLNATLDQLPPVVAFIQKYVLQIYIVTLSGLVFLWYLEHGQHIVSRRGVVHKRKLRH